ncbi:MAG: porin [Polaromonas sp.]|uniref:porin n=1 Tax=Polaromonas sp. TaxID=1869339 RepID=UPI003263157D
MKAAFRNMYLGAACVAALAPQMASAQSTVTLYGRVVSGLAYIDKVYDPVANASFSKTMVASNQWGTSMWGLKGNEDLGGGLAANFVLEGGFELKNGGAGAGLFNRRAYVGLSNASWGSFRLGKNLFISNDVWDLDPTGQQWVGSATLVRGRSWVGANNVVEYSTPNMGGFSATGQISFGEQAGNSKANRGEGISMTYANQDLMLRAIYSRRHDVAGTFTDVYNTSKETIIGGTYKIGPAKLFAAYDYITAPNALLTAPSKLKHGWVGVRYDVTPALTLIGSVFHVKADRVAGKATLAMVGADYSMSKRTLLYASFGGVRNSSGANFGVDTGISGNPAANQSQRTVYAGIAHSF